MKKLFVTCLALIVLSLFSLSGAHAALVVLDDPVFGEDSIILDTEASLEWLHLSKSFGLSRSYVNTQFGVDGAFAGFQYATVDEAVALMVAAGVPIGKYITGDEVINAVANFASLVGQTDSQSGYPEIISMSGSGSIVGADFVRANGQASYKTGATGLSWGEGMTDGSSWLMREASAAPIPGAVWLLGSGLLGLLGLRRKK